MVGCWYSIHVCCGCVHQCVCHKSVFCWNGWIYWAEFWQIGLFPVLCCKEIRVSQYFCGELCPRLSIRKNLPQPIDCRKKCRLSSSNGRLQFITLSVHHCVQHDGRDTALAETCYYERALTCVTGLNVTCCAAGADSSEPADDVVCRKWCNWRWLSVCVHWPRHNTAYSSDENW